MTIIKVYFLLWLILIYKWTVCTNWKYQITIMHMTGIDLLSKKRNYWFTNKSVFVTLHSNFMFIQLVINMILYQLYWSGCMYLQTAVYVPHMYMYSRIFLRTEAAWGFCLTSRNTSVRAHTKAYYIYNWTWGLIFDEFAPENFRNNSLLNSLTNTSWYGR